jgi:hypothetical protein
MNQMPFQDLREFIAHLEKNSVLLRAWLLRSAWAISKNSTIVSRNSGTCGCRKDSVRWSSAGFDLIYACQDVEIDRREGLHSVPARFGIAAALRWAKINHALTILALAAVGILAQLGVLYWIGWLIAATLLTYENAIVKPNDLSRLDQAFFNVNGYISVIVFISALAGLWTA